MTVLLLEDIRPTIGGSVGEHEALADVIADRDVESAYDLEQADEEMDQLRKSCFRMMLDDSWPHGVEPAVDIALLGRYYERIADHAVSIARRVVFLVTGEHPQPA